MGIFLFQGAPKPIAIEPCSGNRAAVLTVFLCLPRGPSGVPPPGQSGKAHIGEHHVCPRAMQCSPLGQMHPHSSKIMAHQVNMRGYSVKVMLSLGKILIEELFFEI